MLKKIVILFAVLLVPVLIISSGDTIGRDNWTYQDLKSLCEAGIITKPLTQETLTRAEVVEYINDGVHNVLAANKTASSSSSDTELMAQIDKLYNLVKAYMTDMMKTQQKLDSILETIGDLKVKKELIEKRQDRLLNAMGMRINGESSAYMTDVLIYGSKLMATNTPAQRYRPITQYLDLKFSLNATKELYSEATFRVENMFGGFWGSQDIYGLRRFFIQGQYPVSFIFGDYQGKLTPFTLWAVDDERPYEAKVFSDKRDMNKKELYLMDNTWPLSGGKVQTIMEILDTVDVDITAIGARLGEAGKNSNYKTYVASSSSFTTVSYSHDQYLFGGSIHTGLPELLKVGVNYSEIVDSKDTGTYTAPVLDNYVTSGDADLKYAFGDAGYAKADFEFARSAYTSNKGVKAYIYDNALKGGAEINFFNSTITGSYSAVGTSFTAYAAQTRMYNQDSSIPYLTQNSTWNISTNPPSYMTGGVAGKVYPFTKYNSTINVSYNGLAYQAGNLLFFPVYENNSMPYGDSTPNRRCITIKYSGNYMEGLIEPSLKYQAAEEIYSPIGVTYKARTFGVVEAGLKSGFTLGIPWSVNVGYKTENTNNSQKVSLISNTFDAGIEATIIRKKLNAYAGYKSIAFAGTEYALVGASYYLHKYDAVITSIGGGLEFYVAKPAVIGLSFTTTTILDKNNMSFSTEAVPSATTPQSYNVQELDIKVSISF